MSLLTERTQRVGKCGRCCFVRKIPTTQYKRGPITYISANSLTHLLMSRCQSFISTGVFIILIVCKFLFVWYIKYLWLYLFPPSYHTLSTSSRTFVCTVKPQNYHKYLILRNQFIHRTIKRDTLINEGGQILSILSNVFEILSKYFDNGKRQR